DKVAEVKEMVGVMFQGAAGDQLTNVELGILDEVLRELYRSRGFTSDPASLYSPLSSAHGREKKPMPTLSDLLSALKARLPATERLVHALLPYVAGGSMGIFDGESQVDLSGAVAVCFDISQLENRFLKPLAMHVALNWTWDKFAKKNRRKKRIVVDEAWKLLYYPDAAVFLERAARTGRKWNVSLTCV
ncbi:MAG: type VI secretion protein, partial [Thermoleophilia bacterium]|nr:type VI secretion protein [Thermoleophilia bacterium]